MPGGQRTVVATPCVWTSWRTAPPRGDEDEERRPPSSFLPPSGVETGAALLPPVPLPSSAFFEAMEAGRGALLLTPVRRAGVDAGLRRQRPGHTGSPAPPTPGGPGPLVLQPRLELAEVVFRTRAGRPWLGCARPAGRWSQGRSSRVTSCRASQGSRAERDRSIPGRVLPKEDTLNPLPRQYLGSGRVKHRVDQAASPLDCPTPRRLH